MAIKNCLPWINDKGKFEQRLSDEFSRFGFNAKPKLSKNLYEVEFCSKLFWPTEDGIVLGPKPGRCLPKMGCGFKKLDPMELRGMLKGWAIDGWFVPGITTYITHVDPGALSAEVRPRFENLYSTHSTKYHNPTFETKVFFLNRYGIEAKDFVESLDKAMVNRPNYVDCPMMEPVYAKDI